MAEARAAIRAGRFAAFADDFRASRRPLVDPSLP
jgi:hypothetical protein